MIKNVKWIFVVLIISSLISFSFVGKNTPTEGLTIGDKAPTFTICGEKQLIDLKDLRGKYVLLSFWASYDALSRMQNATLNHRHRPPCPRATSSCPRAVPPCRRRGAWYGRSSRHTPVSWVNNAVEVAERCRAGHRAGLIGRVVCDGFLGLLARGHQQCGCSEQGAGCE